MANVLYYEDIQLVDGVKSYFGTGSDLEIYHDGSNSYIRNTNTNLIIKNEYNDGDIIFESDDGSGNIAEYFRLDGSAEQVKFNKNTEFQDNVQIQFGNSSDLKIYHSAGASSYIENSSGDFYVMQRVTDGDMLFTCDDGSGGDTTYIRIDGGAENINIAKNTVHPDSIYTYWGDANDFYIGHDSTNTNLINSTGHLYISNYADDKQIIFQNDDGSGGVETYFYLDGLGGGSAPFTVFPDAAVLAMGSNHDTYIQHTGAHMKIDNYTGNLEISNQADDGDLSLRCDNGSGGSMTYIKLDGGIATTLVYTDLLMVNDGTNGKLKFGASQDLQIYHDGSNSYIQDTGTGSLKVGAANFHLMNAACDEYMMTGTPDQGVILYYNNSTKFQTTSTGVSVTGGANLSGNIVLDDNSGASPNIQFINEDGDSWYIYNDSNGKFQVQQNSTIRATFSSGDLELANDLKVSGGGITLLGTGRIQGIDTVSAATDAASKTYVDTEITSALTGVLSYQGTWNANTNSPTLSSGSGTPGYYYIVSTAGSTNLDGITDWAVGDWAVFSDQATDAWQKIDNTAVGNVSGSGVSSRVAYWNGTGTITSTAGFTFNGNLAIPGYLTVSGSKIESPGAFTIDVAGQLNLDSGNSEIHLKGSGTTFGKLFVSGSDFYINNPTQDEDILFTGNDGGSSITALTLDMSSGGTATFNNELYIPNYIYHVGDGNTYFGFSGADTFLVATGGTTALTIDSSQDATFAGQVNVAETLKIGGATSGTKTLIFESTTNAQDYNIDFYSNAGSVQGRINYAEGGGSINLLPDSSATAALSLAYDGNATFANNVTVGHDLKMPTSGEIDWNAGAVKLIGTADDIKLQGGSLSITGDGSNAATLTESGSGDFTIATVDDLRLDSGGNDIVLRGASSAEFGRLTNDSQNFDIRNITADKDIRFKGNNSGSTITALTLDMSADGAATFNSNISSGGHVYVTDGNKFIAGSGEDLQIYHNGTHSYIDDAGTGKLILRGNSAIELHKYTGEYMITAVADGAVSLYYNDSKKFETTNTGADIDGTLTLDTLAYGGSATTALSFGMNSFSFANASGTIISCNSSRTVSIQENLTVSGITSDADVTLSDSDLVLSGDSNIELDTSVSSTQSSGTIIKIGSHMSALVAGNIYYAYNSMGSLYWAGADADSNTTEHMIALSVGTDADVDGMLLNGIYHKASHGLTVGDPIYLSTTPMTMTNTAPSGSGDYVRVLGYAIDSNHIYFCPDNTWVKID